MQKRIHFALVLFSLHVTAAIALAQTSNAELEPKHESDCHKVDEAFSKASDADVSVLFGHPNRAVRMRAFWERERRHPSASDGKMERLVGNYEACLGMELPRWWAQGLKEGTFEKPTWFEFPESALESLKLRSVKLEDNFVPEALGDIGVKLEGDRLQIDVRGKKVSVEKETVQRRDKQGLTTIGFESTPKGDYFVQADPFGTKFVVSQLDKSGRVRWSSEGWATGDYPGSGNGFCLCHFSIVAHLESVFVFGYCAGSHFVEEFECKGGRPRMRFCSTYTRSK